MLHFTGGSCFVCRNRFDCTETNLPQMNLIRILMTHDITYIISMGAPIPLKHPKERMNRCFWLCIPGTIYTPLDGCGVEVVPLISSFSTRVSWQPIRCPAGGQLGFCCDLGVDSLIDLLSMVCCIWPTVLVNAAN